MASNSNALLTEFQVKKDLLISMKEKFRCSECQETNNPSHTHILRCKSKVHIYCRTCYDKIQVVRQNFGKECTKPGHPDMKPCRISKMDIDLLHDMLKQLPLFCKFEPFGCNEAYFEEDLANHEAKCNFRLVECCYQDCRQRVPLTTFLEHFDKSHSLIGFHGSKKYLQSNTYQNQLNVTFGAQNYLYGRPSVVIWSNITFLEYGLIKGQFMYRWIYILSDPDEAKKYSIRATIKLQSQAITYSGNVLPIDITSEKVMESQNAIIIGMHQVQSMLDQGMNVFISYDFFLNKPFGSM